MDKYLVGGNDEDGARLLSVVPTDRTRGNGRQLKHIKFHLNYLNHEGSQTLAQIAQRGCGVSIHEDGQNATGQGPRQTALAGIARAGGLD